MMGAVKKGGAIMAKFGFIGVGNMGGAVAAAAAKLVHPREILVSSGQEVHAAAFAQAMGVEASDNDTIAREAKFVVLGVKPQVLESVLLEIRPLLEVRTDAILVTMAAGIPMQQITDVMGGGYPVIRIMPNLAVRVGEGITLYDANDRVKRADLEEFLAAMSATGRLDPVPEKLMDAGSAVAGCGPAFACLFAEALADGGVACGLPRQKAAEYAAQMLLGTAKYLQETGLPSAVLKDRVCSPGGSTIQGVRALEQGGFRSAVMEAVIASYEKNKEFFK